jgi:hypothetical protein
MMSEEAFVQAIFDAALQDRIKGEIADRENPSAEVAAVRRYLGLK